MTASLSQVILALLAGIAVILLLTIRFRIHAFFALLAACLVTGLGNGLSPVEIIGLVKEGFGNILKSLSLIIVLGTTLGLILEQNGSTRVIADFVLSKMGKKQPAFAMSITGFITGLPIFCDSGYIVLCGLNPELSRRTGVPVIFIATSLATGLLAVHCLIPPHPGATAAASELGVDFGRLIFYGILIAIPATLTGYFWTQYAAKRVSQFVPAGPEKQDSPLKGGPSLTLSILPIIVPIFLIALRSVWQLGTEQHGASGNFLIGLGDPVIALSIGIALAFIPAGSRTKTMTVSIFRESVEKAGSILMIIGAGGAFGAVLAAAKPGEHLGAIEGLKHLGLLFPFLLTMLLKTAQGSSTVAIITASTIIKPLLPLLGLDDANGHLLAVLSMGGGSMIISHANDAYFWVISKFSAIDMRGMLRVYSLATLWMGLTTLGFVYLLSLFLS